MASTFFDAQGAEVKFRITEVIPVYLNSPDYPDKVLVRFRSVDVIADMKPKSAVIQDETGLTALAIQGMGFSVLQSNNLIILAN